MGTVTMKAMRVGIGITLAVLLTGGCAGTKEIRTFHDLRSVSTEILRVMARDTTFYEFRQFTVLDSALEGSGERIVNGVHSPFAGRLPYSDLVYIQAKHEESGRTLFVLAAVGLTISGLSAATEWRGLVIAPTGTGSCPYIYTWDGDRYALQGEAFGTSFGRALEAGTTCMLPAARRRGDAVTVRLTNERPETHYVNSARLLAFETAENSTVLIDDRDRAWPVADPRPPIRPSRKVPCDDGAGFRDAIEITLPHPKDGRTGSIIVHAINTELVNAVYEMVFGYLGDQSLPFLYQIENDPQLIATLRDWIRECSLTVEVWREDRWVDVGAIGPEASTAPFSRIVRIDATGIEEDSVRVRLTSLADSWRIDAVTVDWTPAVPLPAHVMDMRAAEHSEAGSVMGDLSRTDGSYSVLLPGQRIDMSFPAYRPGPNRKVAYALEVRGFLYEWPPAAEAAAGGATFLPASLGSDRLAVVNDLVRHRDVFLPLVYARWRSVGNRLPRNP
jgi:hypothetical protein